ncbi:hypothetical protein C8A05DRAFT_39671, partial [Staphylotrichum tortipilum]
MEQTTATEKSETGTPVPPSSNNSNVAFPLKGNEHSLSSPSSTPREEDVTIVSFEPSDPANPHNWGLKIKSYIFLVAFICTTTTSFSSTLPSNFSPPLPVVFNVTNPTGSQRVLPASLYLAGYMFGPLV